MAVQRRPQRHAAALLEAAAQPRTTEKTNAVAIEAGCSAESVLEPAHEQLHQQQRPHARPLLPVMQRVLGVQKHPPPFQAAAAAAAAALVLVLENRAQSRAQKRLEAHSLPLLVPGCASAAVAEAAKKAAALG